MRIFALTAVLLVGFASFASAQVTQTSFLVSGGGVHSAAGIVTMSSNLGDVLVGPSLGAAQQVWHGFYTPIPQSLVGVDDAPLVTFTTRLGNMTPNPARAMASIELSNAVQQSVDLSLYDVTGRRVRQLRTGTLRSGIFRIPWDLRTDAGQSVPAGIYFVRLATRDFQGVRRVVVIR